MVCRSGYRWIMVLIVTVGLASAVFALDKVQPTPGAIQLGNFDGAKTKIQPYDDRAGNRFSISKTAIVNDAIEGDQAMQYTYKLDGWCGFALAASDAKAINWDWSAYDSFSFWFKGQNSGVKFGLDLQDKGDERFAAYFVDDSTEWKQVVFPLSSFILRPDYQDPNAKRNGTIDWPLKAFAVYVLTPKVASSGIFDDFEVLPKK